MRISVLTSAVTALCLGACDSAPAGNEAAAVNMSENTAEAAPAAAGNSASPVATNAAAPTGGPALTTEYLVGNWAEGDCAKPDVQLNADGTTEGGRWELRGNQLVRITSEGEDPALELVAVDADHFQVSFAGLPPQTMKRCR